MVATVLAVPRGLESLLGGKEFFGCLGCTDTCRAEGSRELFDFARRSTLHRAVELPGITARVRSEFFGIEMSKFDRHSRSADGAAS
ncbi:hypothetical protein CIW51_11010 [Mycolicibacterium sp. P9-22]|nr:hypothetical protein CIW51_11010 [Mycolicibacterium sp. P9-22]